MLIFYSMTKDITPELMKKYFESGKLGKLSVQIPDCGTISADLTQLYRHATGLKFFEYQTSPKNIEAMAVYGSVLYKHFPQETMTKTKKIWVLFGPEVQKEITKPREMPKDFDVMVITREGLTDDKIIVPKKKLVDTGYGYVESTIPTAVETKELVAYNYGYIEVRGGSNLHIVYRSVEQLLSGLGKEDTVSESVVRCGIPIIGQNRFGEIVQDVASPKRETLHQIEWNEDLEGILQGKIL